MAFFRRFTCCIVLFICTLSVSGIGYVGVEQYVLVVNSYVESAVWPNYIFDAVKDKFVDSKTSLKLQRESLNFSIITDRETLDKRVSDFIEKYARKRPEAIVIIGEPIWICLREKIAEHWEGIPIILCTITDYVTSIDKYLERRELLLSERIPLEKTVEGFNVTVVRYPIYIRETIELMTRLLPQMDKLFFISDRRFISTQIRADMKRSAQSHFPHIDIHYLTEGELSMEMVLDSIHSYDKNVGLLFYSWFEREVQKAYMSSYSYKTFSTLDHHSIFTLEDVGIHDGYMAGGYFCCGYDLGHTVVNVLSEIIDEKKKATDIPWQPAGKADYNLCYNILEAGGISPRLYPKNAKYFFAPEPFFYKHRYVLIALLILSLVIYLMYIHIRHLKRERILRHREMDILAKYKTLFKNTPIGYAKLQLVFDSKGYISDYRFIEVNPQFEKAFAKSTEVINKTKAEVPVLKDCDVYLNKYCNEIHNGEPFSLEYYYREADKYYEVNAISQNEDGILDAFVTDITEIHKMQSKLELTNHKLSVVLNVSGIVPWKMDVVSGMIEFDVRGSIDSILEETGSAFRVSLKEFLSFIWKEDMLGLVEEYTELIEGKTDKMHQEYRILNPITSNKAYDWVEVQAVVDKRDKSSRAISLIGSYLIITDRKKMEFDLLAAKNRAEEANRLKTAFLANISHEVRTPLNSIVGFSNVLMHAEDKEEQEEYMKIIEYNNNLLLKLVDDMIDLSEIESGDLFFDYIGFDLNNLLDEIEHHAKLKVLSEEKIIDVSLEKEAASYFIYSDNRRLKQIFTNLINNAVKFTREGNITLGYKRQHNRIYFYVRDTGQGIPTDRIDNIFERFVKLDEFGQGTGIGLSICKIIVDKMGGEIGVESVENVGSTFWFTIPYTPFTPSI